MITPVQPRPLRIVLAPDSLKGSLPAAEAALAMSRGVAGAARRLGHPAPDVVLAPLADGGEGTLDALLAAWGAASRSVACHDAAGRPRTARYGLSARPAGSGRPTRGVLEAAEANGLPFVADLPLDALSATSYGVGEIAARLLDDGAEEILLCVGGSATTDGGVGLLSALGARFLDRDGNLLPPGGGSLAALARIDLAGLHPRAAATRWRIAVDVDNPLCGPRGAAAVFGPQKGATSGDVAVLDHGLAHLARVLAEATGVDVVDLPGMGAAGGLAAVLVAFFAAEIVPGSALVADAVGLAAALADADLVLTGEGSFDSQSLGGKVVQAVVENAPATCAVVAIAGRVQLGAAQVQDAGLAAAFSLATGPLQLEDLIRDAGILMEETAAHVYGVFAAARTGPGVRP
ncbi:glycerate kinase [Arthrobacter agilis]|uniref:glycerate kinase n=1 Tax=Arthrobacter agilis TaxID=37921 RepID=UPI000B34DC56|nr:glycerate kinase [Arthrobacter agilis]OUM42365.1 glycerate kinase [Arthrobacter agilis]PPB45707.1 glycerate kinase [Arthrobacter agilis]TPV26312.1 glycerate kinase [Arthrobacter agilis]VDR30832.1 Glycerate kinase [Arthrobacter agilis]